MPPDPAPPAVAPPLDAVDAGPLRPRTNSPAPHWEHALISGDGRQGVLLWGEADTIRLTLSHERLFAPVTPPIEPPGTAAILPELRRLLLGGDRQAAADWVVELAAGQGFTGTHGIDPFIGAAMLTWRPDHPRPSDRGTDHRTGVIDFGGLSCFVSRTHRVVAIALPGPGELRLDPIDGEPAGPTVHSRPDPLTLRADFPAAWPGAITGYSVTCHPSGPHHSTPSGLRADGPMLVLVRTVVDAGAPLGPAATDEPPLHAVPRNWAELLAAHGPEQARLIDSCLLRLPDDPRTEQLFAAGRYAIAGSVGQLPPTLQGVWSGSHRPAWASGFTLDGNLAAALAAAGPTGVPQLLLPVFDLVDAVRDQLRDNARRLYGARGLLAPPHVSSHARHNHFGPTWCLTFWTGGAAWLAKLAMEYCRYTGDATFLRERAWPLLVEVAEFYLDFAPDGRFVPSYSPENAPAGSGSQAALNATMDVALVRSLLRDLDAAAAALGQPADGAPILADLRSLAGRLPDYQVREGELAEWLWPGLDPQPAHRHASHLFGLWYDRDPAFDSALLADAAAVTIDRRLDWWDGHGDEMAFGLAQLGIAAAALGRTDAADRCLRRMHRYWRANLVSTHNLDEIFNVDLCGGLPALVAAMLLRSDGDRIELLPAAPARWRHGEIRGLVARGDLTRPPLRLTRLAWTPQTVEVSLLSPVPHIATISSGGNSQVVSLIASVQQSFTLPRC